MDTRMSQAEKERQMKQNLVKGVVFMLLSALGFATMNLFSRLAGPIPSTQKVFIRNVIVFIVTFIAFMRESRLKGMEKISSKNWGLLFLRGGIGMLGILGNFYAVDHLPLSDATILAKLAPFFAIVFSFFLLREKINRTQILTLVLALIGALLVVRPSFENPNLLAYLIAFGGGMFAGLAYTFVRVLSMRGVNKNLVIMFFGAFTTVALAPFMITSFVPMTREQTVYMILVGFCGVVGQYGMTFAYATAPARSISIFDYSQVVFSAILSALILHEYPLWISLGGYLIIFIASLILFLSNYRAAKRASEDSSLS